MIAALHARPRPTTPAVLAGDDTGHHHADQVDDARPGRYRGLHRGPQQPGRHETGDRRWSGNLVEQTGEIDADLLRRLVDGDATAEVTP